MPGSGDAWLRRIRAAVVPPCPLLCATALPGPQYGVFILSAGFCVLFLLFSMFLIPETKGVPLDKVRGAATHGGQESRRQAECAASCCPPPRPQIQELLRQHWLWKPFMKELQEAADREAAEAEAAAAAKGLPMESAASGASGARTPGEPAGLGAKAA